MHVHIATVGKFTDIITSVIMSIGAVDRVYLLPSEGTESVAKQIKSSLSNKDIRIMIVYEYDFMNVLRTIYDIKKNIDEEFKEDVIKLRNMEYSINITGGRKTMVTAAAVASYYLHADIYYQKENKEGLMDLKDTIVKIDQLSIFDDSKLSKKNKTKTEMILRYLYYMEEQGLEVTKSMIANELGYSPQVVSFQVNNLITNGLVERSDRYKADGSIDQRSHYVKLSGDGSMRAKHLPPYKNKK